MHGCQSVAESKLPSARVEQVACVATIGEAPRSIEMHCTIRTFLRHFESDPHPVLFFIDLCCGLHGDSPLVHENDVKKSLVLPCYTW